MVKQHNMQHHTANEKKLQAYEEETLVTRIHMKRKQFDNLLFNTQTQTHLVKQHGRVSVITRKAGNHWVDLIKIWIISWKSVCENAYLDPVVTKAAWPDNAPFEGNWCQAVVDIIQIASIVNLVCSYKCILLTAKTTDKIPGEVSLSSSIKWDDIVLNEVQQPNIVEINVW